MVRIQKISKPEIEPLIRLSYEGDTDLLEKYFPVKSTQDELINESASMINVASKEYKMSYYKVIFNNEPIGYFVCSKQFLYSFAIGIKFRKKEILMKWWASVKEILGKAFTVILYENNTRAISFLEKQGMEIYKKQGNLVTLINYK